MSPALHTVHIRVNDAATGQPTPARLRITDGDGTYYAPFGRLTEFATEPNLDVGGNLMLGDKAYAYIDGSAEIQLPSGNLYVEISKGPEYRPVHAPVVLGVGKMALRFTTERGIDPSAKGWYAGDTRCHCLPPHAAILEAAAEDLAIVNLLATETEVIGAAGRCFRSLSNILAFSGQKPALAIPGHCVVVNTLNMHPTLGSLGLLNTHRPVYPLHFGGPDGFEDWGLVDWCRQAHRKGGLAVWVNARQPDRELRHGEALADLILGEIDALELDDLGSTDLLEDWYRLLRCGLHVPLVGASAKNCNAVPLGSVRTYARLPAGEPLSYSGWIEAIRAGRTFVTAGPILEFEVDGQMPGSVIELPEDRATAHVSATAQSWEPFDSLELVVDGAVREAVSASGTPAQASLDLELAIHKPAALAVRCRNNGRVVAHSSAIRVKKTGQSWPRDANALQYFRESLEKTLGWLAQKGRYRSDRDRAHLEETIRQAQTKLASRPE